MNHMSNSVPESNVFLIAYEMCILCNRGACFKWCRSVEIKTTETTEWSEKNEPDEMSKMQIVMQINRKAEEPFRAHLTWADREGKKDVAEKAMENHVQNRSPRR